MNATTIALLAALSGQGAAAPSATDFVAPAAAPSPDVTAGDAEVTSGGADVTTSTGTVSADVTSSAPSESSTSAPEPEGPQPAPPPPQPAASDVAAPAPAPVAEVTEAAPPKPDKCRDGASDLLPPKELELACPHEVDVSGMKYKPGTGLVVRSKNGRFSLETRLRAQLLWTVENENEDDSSTTTGLEIRRARLQFKGFMFNEHNKFKTEFAFSPRDSAFDGVPHRTPILDWYFDFDYLQSLTLRVGQYKVPYSRQRVISSGDLELVDRALAQGEFNVDRDIGFDLRSDDFLGLDKLRYYAGLWMGEGRDYAATDTFEFMYIGRVELLPLGMFDDYKEGDFERSHKPRLSLGAAYAFIDAAKYDRGILGRPPTDGGTTDTHNVTADGVFMWAGLSLSGEFYWRKGIRHFGDATVLDEMGNEVAAEREKPRDGIGWYVQTGYMIPRLPLQIAGRYSQMRRFDSATSSLPNRDEVGGGLSWYIARHPLKLQLDYFRQWEEHDLVHGSDQVRLQLQAGF